MSTLEQSVHQALALHRSGKLAEAEPIYASALKELPDHPDLLHMFGVLKHQQGHSTGAIDFISRAIKVNPLNAAFHNNLGEVLRLTGQHARAIEAYRKAIRLDPTYVAAHFHLGNTLLESRREKEAIASYRLVLELDPGHVGALQWMAIAADRRGEPALALEAFDRLAILKPDDAETARNRAVLHTRAGRFADAAAEYERALTLDATHLPACLSLVDCLEKLNAAKPDANLAPRMQAAYRRILRNDPDHLETMVRLGVLLTSQNQLDEAITLLRDASARTPRDPVILLHLAAALQKVPLCDEALAKYEAAIECDSQNPDIHTAHADLLSKCGCLTEALAAADRALALDPIHAAASGTRARILLDQSRVAANSV